MAETEDPVTVMLRMYADAQKLVASGDPYFVVRGRDLLARLHHMVKSQAPFEELDPLVDRI